MNVLDGRDAEDSHPDGLSLFASASLFVAVYLATLFALAWGGHFHYWSALASVTVATALTVQLIDRGAWRVGFFVTPALALRELAHGIAFAVVLITLSDALVVASTPMHHAAGNGFPWLDLIVVFVPAVLHEELLFRGYLFQKMRAWRRLPAIVVSAALFAALHSGNAGITPLALVNVMFAGVLLAFAYERYRRLWFPIGIHLAWNVFSGPVLGYEVSGYVSRESVLRALGREPQWLTGGTFGIEGSAWMLVTNSLGILWVMMRPRTKPRQEQS